jgi:hypothetical protein
MALWSTQPLTEMSTRELPWGKGQPARKAGNLTSIFEPTVKKMGERRRLTALWASPACYRDSFISMNVANSKLSFISNRSAHQTRSEIIF